MFNITLNGEKKNLNQPGMTVSALVELLGYTGKRIAIERNGEIVPKSQHSTTSLADGDTLEIVVAVGGG